MAGDVYFDNVTLLLHGNGTNGSTSFPDSSNSTHTVTANGNAQVSTAQSKWGGASGLFDGTGDYLTVASSADFQFGTGDFTLECWVYVTASTTTQYIFDFRTTNLQVAPALYLSNNSPRYYVNGVVEITSGDTLTQNAWHHFALSRVSGSTRLFIDGTQTGSTYTDSSNYIQGPLTVGSIYATSSGFYNGYIDDIRITKGVGRYTTSFTVPAEEFPDFASTLLQPTIGTSTSTGYTPTLSNGFAAAPTIGTATTTGYTPQHSNFTFYGTPTQGTSSETGATPTISYGFASAPTQESTSETGLIPTLSNGFAAAPTIGASTSTGYTPKHSEFTFFGTPIQGTSAESGLTPSLSYGFSDTPTQGTSAETGYAPAFYAIKVTGYWYYITPDIRMEFTKDMVVTGQWFDTTPSIYGGTSVTGDWFDVDPTINLFGDETAYITGQWFDVIPTIEFDSQTNGTITGSWFDVKGYLYGGVDVTGKWFDTTPSIELYGPESISVTGQWFDIEPTISMVGSYGMSVTGDWFDVSLYHSVVTGQWFDTIPVISFSDSTALIQAFVMNVHTTDVSRYQNYAFKHIIHIGGKPYGVKSDGIYLLEGSTDSGTAISGSITTKETDFGAFNSKNVPYVYLNSDTETSLTSFVDGTESVTYTSGFGGRKTHLGRGDKGRYWKFKIDDIERLEGMEILPHIIQRRVK